MTPPTHAPHLFTRSLAAGLVMLACGAFAQEAKTTDKQDYSKAERLLFMTPQLKALKAPATLSYRFSKSGTLEEPFEDKASIAIAKQPDGSCCLAKGEFLSGTRRMSLPEIENPEANPVLLYFLEHDVREMQRITKGSQSYYRKRIRMAVYQGATVTDVSLRYRGQPLAAQRIEISPYLDDPARSRFEKYARKTYQFFLADGVPGGVVGIRSVMRPEAADAQPLVVEELLIDGAEPIPNLPAS